MVLAGKKNVAAKSKEKNNNNTNWKTSLLATKKTQTQVYHMSILLYRNACKNLNRRAYMCVMRIYFSFYLTWQLKCVSAMNL